MRSARGFSLVELMVVVALIGVVLAIAVPSYREHIRRANRAAAGAVLMEIVSRQEQYAATNRAYAEDAGGVSALVPLGITPPAEVSSNYTFTVSTAAWSATATVSVSGFEAIATPIAGSVQEGDAPLKVNQFGLKTPVGVWRSHGKIEGILSH